MAEKFFYKFRSLDQYSKEFTKKVIVDNELYFPAPIAFNDPFDCKPKVTLECTNEEFKTYLDGYFDRQFPGISNAKKKESIRNIVKDKSRNQHSALAYNTIKNGLYNELVQMMGVYCISESCSQTLMWSHYSDSHRGVCLRFKVNDQTIFFKNAEKVLYKLERPFINLIKDSPRDFQEKILYIKSSDWEYEKEWRIVNKLKGTVKYPEEILDAVILGINISKENKDEVIAWCNSKKHKPKIIQAKIMSDKFGLIIKD